MTDETELERQLKALADIPEDVVPPEPTAEGYRALDRMTGHDVTVNTPGEPIEGPDGALIGMTAGSSQSAYLAPATVTAAELANVGLTAADVPNLDVIDTTKEKK